MIPWLTAGKAFPPVESALSSPNGLLAASVDVSPQRLLSAYPRGIFPWYSPGEPVLWWSPDPRMVLFTDELHVSRSLSKVLRKVARADSIELRFDAAFEDVIAACAAPRDDGGGTWITPEIMRAYTELHYRGFAHSVETWLDGQLVGGLYGVSMGRMFFGESMFARTAEASKIALVVLVRILLIEKVRLIDCQQNTRHLASLGGREISRREFIGHLRSAVAAAPIDWRTYRDRRLNGVLAAASD